MMTVFMAIVIAGAFFTLASLIGVSRDVSGVAESNRKIIEQHNTAALEANARTEKALAAIQKLLADSIAKHDMEVQRQLDQLLIRLRNLQSETSQMKPEHGATAPSRTIVSASPSPCHGKGCR